MTLPRALGATYRLQLGPSRTFFGAARLVPYLASLGVATLYCSPVIEAVPGSEHGYDGTDPTALRRELGGEVGYAAMVAACEHHGLGLLVDLAPNHLSTWPGGRWWRLLLAEGRHGPAGEVFDVDWDAGSGEAKGKVALPLLDRPLEVALGSGLVHLGERGGAAVLEVGDADLPLSGGPLRQGEDLLEVLMGQHYRLVDWHHPCERNYRRFFDIDGLAGVRVEVPEVFEATHALVVRLARAGRLSAIRVDHVDGLRQPAAYLRRLAAATGVPIVVEKILTADERLPAGWPVLGTTGYEVIDDLAGALVEPEGLARLVAEARAEGEEAAEAASLAGRRLVVEARFPAELGRAAERLGVGQRDLGGTLARLPCYRTYLDGAPASAEDGAAWRAAVAAGGSGLVADAVLRPGALDGAEAVQQLSGAVMAKGVEDTAWYRLAGPLALCEVGGDAAGGRRQGVERLWSRAAERGGLAPGSTHDTKRSADVRCRLYALSELPEPFVAGLARFRRALGLPSDGGPQAFETRLVAQLLLGTLPPLAGDGPAGNVALLGDAATPAGDGLAERIRGVLAKWAREAKLRSSWEQPDEAYEASLAEIAEAGLAGGGALLRASFGALVDEVARLGAVNSLSSVVVRSLLPGVPDCYQGDEVWNLSLVDPDNRRPVDFEALGAGLAAVAGASPGEIAGLRRCWRDGRVKLLVTTRCLAPRRAAPAAFGPSAPLVPLVPLAAEGGPGGSVLAAARRSAGGAWALAVVTRHASRLEAPAGDLPAGPSYAGGRLRLPDGAPRRWLETLGGRELAGDHGGLPLEEVLAELPVAFLVGLGGRA